MASTDYLSGSPIGQELVAVTGASTARVAMERLARQALAEAEIRHAPVNLRQVASFQRVRDIVEVDMPSAGRLVPHGPAFTIEVRRDDPPGRKRFTIGHEIGHLLIPGYRANPSLITDVVTGTYPAGPDRALETLCDIAAAELTMPMKLFGPVAAECGCSLSVIGTLCDHFQGSWIATLRRLVETNLWPCAMVVWYLDGRASIESGQIIQGTPRIRYSIQSRSFDCVLSDHLPAPIDGCIAQHFARGVSNSILERLELADGASDFYVQVQRPPRDEWPGMDRHTRVSLLLPYRRGQPWPGKPTTWVEQEHCQ